MYEIGDLMTDVNRKPWLTASEQIDHLKTRGCPFLADERRRCQSLPGEEQQLFSPARLSIWVS